MSLLLDALKKAAQEKQNADSAETRAESEASLGLVPETEPTPTPTPTPTPEPELTLEIEEAGEDSGPVPEELDLDLELSDEQPFRHGTGSEDIHQPIQTIDVPGSGEPRITPTPSTVTDEALQLLIHKTNNDYRKSRFLIWGGVAIGALVLLSISGFYFYSDMMHEIDSMHRKHQIALATLKSKTRIEENLTSLANVPDSGSGKDLKDKAVAVAGKSDNTAKKQSIAAEKNKAAAQTLTVERADTRDPISQALERGWFAYQNKDYETSRREYNKVLKNEPDNHDALLGIAAVALQQEEIDKARDIYIGLLERDPRDPHAHAGLANIAQTNGSNLSESRLKQLIEYRPDDSHLQFALGNLYVQKKSWPEAQQAFFNAWKADSNNPDYAYNLAVSLDQLGKHREAKAYYQDSLELATGKNISFSTEAVKSRLAYLGSIQP